MKIPLQYIDTLGEDLQEGTVDSFLDIKHQVAKLNSVDVTDVEIRNHMGVSEWVVYVKGSFLDYLEDKDLIEGYWRGYYEL